MNVQFEKIFMAGYKGRDDDRNKTSYSKSSYDSSSSDERKRYNSRKSVINVRIGNATTIGCMCRIFLNHFYHQIK